MGWWPARMLQTYAGHRNPHQAQDPTNAGSETKRQDMKSPPGKIEALKPTNYHGFPCARVGVCFLMTGT